jgi:Protein tyrosine and serine/threonine kinase
MNHTKFHRVATIKIEGNYRDITVISYCLEYGVGGRPSIEGDVYSYGILLLELFTGLSPTDERLGDNWILQKHVEMTFPEQIMDIIDAKLFSQIDGQDHQYTSENVYGCLVAVIQCALLCSKESPKERITMKDVVKELNSAQKKLLGY